MKSPETQKPHILRELALLPDKASRAFARFAADRALLWKMCADIELLPEGRELLRFARKNKVAILFAGPEQLGNHAGESLPPQKEGDSPVVTLNRAYGRTQLAIILLHELRHSQQQLLVTRSGILVPTLRDEAFLGRVMEADAFTFQTVMALRLKKLGRPEFFDAMNDVMTPAIRKFVKAHPPENFADEQAFARGLFTHVALHPHRVYTNAYLSRVKACALCLPGDRDKKLPLDKISGSGLDRLYGPDFLEGDRMRALKAAVLQTWSAWDRATIRAAEKMQESDATLEETVARQRYLSLRIKFRNADPRRRKEKLAGRTFETYAAGRPAAGAKTGLLERHAHEILLIPPPRKPRGKAPARKRRKAMKR